MRGEGTGPQPHMWCYGPLEQRIPADHPLRPLRAMVDTILDELSPQFDQLYSKVERPSTPPSDWTGHMRKPRRTGRSSSGRCATIRSASDNLGLLRPVFAVLNPLIPVPYVTDYRVRDESLPRYLRLPHQAERAAAAAGLRTYNHERELLEQLTEAELFLNELDQHLSARLHQVFGRKLIEVVRSDLEAGRLCR